MLFTCFTGIFINTGLKYLFHVNINVYSKLCSQMHVGTDDVRKIMLLDLAYKTNISETGF